jgi:hypothetical protein
MRMKLRLTDGVTIREVSRSNIARVHQAFPGAVVVILRTGEGLPVLEESARRYRLI